MYKYKVITEDLRYKYISDLKRDSEKDFGSEFIRTTDLESVIINEYGFNGLKLVLSTQKMGDIHPMGSMPQDSPWFHINDKSHSEAIDIIFDPIKNDVPRLISIMKERIRFIYAEELNSVWRLNYYLDMKLYDERDYFLIFSGGTPVSIPKENENLLKYNWNIPKDLKKLYSVHNGFGAIQDSIYILDSEQISVMGEMMNPITAEQNVEPEGYIFNDLLEFFPDAAGNSQCFIRKGNNNNITVDWDHEIWGISDEINFFDFVNNRMSELDEE